MYKGIALSIASSCMFAGLYYYATLLSPLNGEEIFGWRMLLTLPCVTLFMLIGREWKLVVTLITRIRHTPGLSSACAAAVRCSALSSGCFCGLR